VATSRAAGGRHGTGALRPVGYGYGGRYFHAPLLAAAPECELVAVVTSSPQRRALVARELPGTATVAALERAGRGRSGGGRDLDPGRHPHPAPEQALRLGLAVVCDKPFALDAAAARGSVELAGRLGLALSPYQNRRWDSEFRTVRQLVGQGVLGEVTRFESRFERFAPQAGPPASGGGTLLDFGSHLVDQALVLLGPAVAVYAESRRRESGLDDDVFLALTHRRGARLAPVGQLEPGRSRPPLPGHRHRGQLRRRRRRQPGGRPGGRADPGHRGGRLGRRAAGLPRPAAPRRRPTRNRSDPERGRWDTFYPAFAAAVRGTGPVPVDPHDAVATATVLDAARTSAATGSVVTLPT
jgi:predicted dehydrogenase